MMSEKILEVRDLNTVFYDRSHKELRVLKDVSFDLYRGKTLCIVGESGCGKSVTVHSVMNLLPKNGKIKSGKILFKDEGKEIELQSIPQYGKEFRKLRGNKISMIFQDPMASLNPVYTVGDQIIEVLLEHSNISKQEAREKAIAMLSKLGIANAQKRIDDYPHQFSGGMKQRVMIAIAMICKPDILIADEPTTALDVTIQAQILDLIKELQSETNAAIIFITHDLGVVAQIADDVAVMYAGEIVEYASAKDIFNSPKHPYTRSLLHSNPNDKNNEKKLYVIEGMVPVVGELKDGCRFAPRIPWIDQSVHEENPKMHEVGEGHFVRCTCYQHFEFQETKEQMHQISSVGDDVVLNVSGLGKYFTPKKKLFQKQRPTVKALDNVSFSMKKGQTVGIVGESGCGKSTLAKSLMKLHEVSFGEIGVKISDQLENINEFKGSKELDFRKKMQMVFQDPYSSLNPLKKIYQSFEEPMIVHGITNRQKRYEIMEKCLKMVNLPLEYLYRYPNEFSGGQRQRICIARALCLSPEILILDEPVSALDLSVQAQVLNYLIEIQREHDLSYILISHDLGVIRYMCDYIYVIHKGRFVESGTIEDIYENPKHIYTQKLLAAIPKMDVSSRSQSAKLRAELELKYDQKYHDFYTRDDMVPDMIQLSNTHFVACTDRSLI